MGRKKESRELERRQWGNDLVFKWLRGSQPWGKCRFQLKCSCKNFKRTFEWVWFEEDFHPCPEGRGFFSTGAARETVMKSISLWMCGRKVVESKLEQGCKQSEAGQNGKGKGLRSNLAKVAGRIDDFTWYSLEEWDEKTSFERVHSIIPFVLTWAGYVLYCIHGGIRKERVNWGSVWRWDWEHAGPWVKECLCKNSVLYIMT